MIKQQTLKESITFTGKGLHTGLDITLTLNPAPADNGYTFQRVDLEGQPVLEAVASNVTQTQRGTVIEKDGISVSTIEHLMAALYAAGIDNCLIQVNAPEVPILDGSSILYSEAIEKAGITELEAKREVFRITKPYHVIDEEKGIDLAI